MDLLNGLGSMLSGAWEATGGAAIRAVGNLVAPPPPPAPQATMTLDAVKIEHANSWEKVARESREQTITAWDQPIGSAPDFAFRQVERDLGNVTQSGASKQVVSALIRNEELRECRLAELSPDERAMFNRVRGSLGDLDAEAALDVLLIEGKLTQGRRSMDGDTLLAALDRLSRSPVHDAIPREELIKQLVREMATPSAIYQGDGINTCTVTTLQIAMAMKDPAEYVRVVAGLASPEGRVCLRNGTEIVREPGTESDDGRKRSISGRLWQPVLMELGREGADYDNATDRHTDGHQGLMMGEPARVLEALTGKPVEYLSANFEIVIDGKVRDDKEGFIQKMRAAAEAGTPVVTALSWSDTGGAPGGHEVLVTRITDDRVYFHNPWGTEDSMDRATFKKRLTGAAIGNFAA